MKKIIKNNLKVFVAIIITVIICTSTTVYAAYNYYAKDIKYKDTNVDDALNKLYEINQKNNSITLSERLISYNKSYFSTWSFKFEDNEIAQNHSKFKINEVSCDENLSSSQLRGSKIGTGNVDMETNNEYLINEYISIWLNIKSTTDDNKGCVCSIKVQFYD
jgi:dolichyl-phosphate-mannose--protein O-mannosyl transferase